MAETWNPAGVAQVAGLFLVAGLAEISGGWLVWQTIRNGRPWYWAACGSGVLVLYGFVPCLQPIEEFGRLYAVYGGMFVAMSYGWGWGVDGMEVDLGDVIGSVVAIVGVCIALFWPRTAADEYAER